MDEGKNLQECHFLVAADAKFHLSWSGRGLRTLHALRGTWRVLEASNVTETTLYFPGATLPTERPRSTEGQGDP